MFPCPEFRLEILPECPSTNDVLLGRRDQADFHGQALLALKQTAGFGRRGRSWWSGEGNLALSIAFRLPQLDAPVTLLPFIAGLAVMDVIGAKLPEAEFAQLKWPNDVYLKGRKLAGIIAQARQSASTTDVVLGLGLNLREAPDAAAIAWAECVEAPSPEEFAVDFLERFAQRLAQTTTFASLQRAWEVAAKLESVTFTVLGEEGEYEALGLLPSGELRVRRVGGEERVLASETVSLRIR